MIRLIDVLEGMNTKDTRVRAVLRRSLAFPPGEYAPAFPCVEPFLKTGVRPWQRQAHYLVAGLWASHWREGRSGEPLPIGKACALHQTLSGSTSTEHRFISLLDADSEQLPHRLRQMIALLNEQALDFDSLLKDLLRWNNEQRPIQLAWARHFYQQLDRESDIESTNKEE